MFDDPLADFERQVEAGKTRVALFEALDDAQGVQVVIETFAETRHLAIQFLFAGMSEGRMADIVRQRQRFGEIFVQLQNGGQGAGNLRHFDGVGEPVAEMIGQVRA